MGLQRRSRWAESIEPDLPALRRVLGGPVSDRSSGERRSTTSSLRDLRRTVGIEAGIIAVVLVALGAVCLLLDPAERVTAFADRHEGLEVDELVLFLALSHLVMVVFGARRARDLKREYVSRRIAEEQLLHRARHDHLTGQLDRDAFVEVVDASAGARAMLLLGVDRFRQVNDTLGHAVGDALLVALAQRLATELGSAGTLARVGADEFAVLMMTARPPDVVAVAHRLREAARVPFALDGVQLSVDVSCGIATSADHTASATELLLHADVAMYAAKVEQLGVLTYAPHMDGDDASALRVYGELKAAISDGQLRVHYQPRASLADGRVPAVEALVRWEHPTRGLLAPAEFLAVAEQTGLVKPLTTAVLDQALADCRRWRLAGRHLMVAVNLSPRSLLEEDLPLRVSAALRAHDLPASCLELEITESAAMSHPDRSLSTLARLRDMGVALSVDDYGTGHASLAYLKTLPVGILKIDRSFVQMMEVDRSDQVIVRSTIDLGHSLGLRVVAEGVETRAAWDQLRHMGCDEAQGFWLSRPVPPEQLPDVLDELHHRLRAAVGRLTA